MSGKTIGTTPFDRLRERMDANRPVCESCGYEHSDTQWEAVTTGAQILYRRECDSCGARMERAFRL
ncbi:HVO_0649 family zinc finger protein [Halopenitus sp. H-Gu1]|uniref:HVO_0649 family zinc finger protein n=1 Tax=Halopenitus sp. H-Gu1 TaxID=3242697 RepID=UPI00359DBBBE